MSKDLAIWTEKLAQVKEVFAPNLTDLEFTMFVELGRSLQLNPFNREIWATKYGNQCSIFVGRDGYRRVAQEQENYNGHIVEAVYSNDKCSIVDGKIKHEFSFLDRGKLVGAYCEVYRKDINIPTRVTVKLEEYNSNQSVWRQKPETMIKKVAEAQALRMAFQGKFAGTYDESENWIKDEASNNNKNNNNKEIIIEDSQAEKLFSELENVCQKALDSGAINEKLFASTLTSGSKAVKKNDTKELELMIKIISEKKAPEKKTTTQKNDNDGFPIDEPEITEDTPVKERKPIGNIEVIVNTIEQLLSELSDKKLLHKTEFDIFVKDVNSAEEAGNLNKLQTIKKTLESRLNTNTVQQSPSDEDRKIIEVKTRISAAWTKLEYHENHIAASIKKHLGVSNIGQCNDYITLAKYFNHLAREYKTRQGE